MKCKNCGDNIRWSETMGWVHGLTGEGYILFCNQDVTSTFQATPRDEDMEWLTK